LFNLADKRITPERVMSSPGLFVRPYVIGPVVPPTDILGLRYVFVFLTFEMLNPLMEQSGEYQSHFVGKF
jgi:hypothetical protein